MVWNTQLAVITAYLITVFILGVCAGRGRPSKVVEYIAAGRSLGFISMYFLMGGAVFSAFAYLGGPGWAYSKGAAAYYILGFCSLGMMPWWLFGPRLLVAGRKYGYVTQAQLFADRFQSKSLSFIVAAVSLLAFIQYISLQMKGSAYIFEVASGGRIPFWAGALIAYAVVVFYVLFSGVRGVAWTNVLQGALMLTVAWVMGLYCVFKFYGGPTEMFNRIAKVNPTHLLVGPGSKMSYADYTSSLIVSALGFIMWPHLFMKAYAAKCERTLKFTVVMYPTFAAFLVPVLFVGFAGVLTVTPSVLGQADRILPYMFEQMNLHPLLLGLVLAAALASAMSSQDAITHAAGSILVYDLVQPITYQRQTDKQTIRIIKVSVMVFGAISYFLAVFGGQSLVALLLGAYGSVVQFLPLAIATFYWPRATRGGALAGICGGVCLNYLIVLGLIPKFCEIHAGIQGLVLNFALLIAVSLIESPMGQSHVDRFVHL